jgi:hypothetical protein
MGLERRARQETQNKGIPEKEYRHSMDGHIETGKARKH